MLAKYFPIALGLMLLAGTGCEKSTQAPAANVQRGLAKTGLLSSFTGVSGQVEDPKSAAGFTDAEKVKANVAFLQKLFENDPKLRDTVAKFHSELAESVRPAVSGLARGAVAPPQSPETESWCPGNPGAPGANPACPRACASAVAVASAYTCAVAHAHAEAWAVAYAAAVAICPNGDYSFGWGIGYAYDIDDAWDRQCAAAVSYGYAYACTDGSAGAGAGVGVAVWNSFAGGALAASTSVSTPPTALRAICETAPEAF